jgi:hypothetical protein
MWGKQNWIASGPRHPSERPAGNIKEIVATRQAFFPKKPVEFDINEN